MSLPPEILKVSIVIGQNEETLIVREGEDPEQIAFEFAQKHGLSDRAANALLSQIQINLDNLS